MSAVVRWAVVLVMCGCAGPADLVPAPGGPRPDMPRPSTTGLADDGDDGWPVPPDYTSSSGAVAEEAGDDATYLGPDPDLPPIECSLSYDESPECPRGEKCNLFPCQEPLCFVCRPIIGSGTHGDACELDPVMLEDDCAAGHICTFLDNRTWKGTCIELCEADSMCSDGTECEYFGGGLEACALVCDPTADDCPVQAPLCAAPQYGAPFSCTGWGLSSVPLEGEACEDRCAPGLLCANAGLLGCETDAAQCCGRACVVDSDSECDPEMGEMCQPYFPLGTAPPGLEHVGLCVVP